MSDTESNMPAPDEPAPVTVEPTGTAQTSAPAETFSAPSEAPIAIPSVAPDEPDTTDEDENEEWEPGEVEPGPADALSGTEAKAARTRRKRRAPKLDSP